MFVFFFIGSLVSSAIALQFSTSLVGIAFYVISMLLKDIILPLSLFSSTLVAFISWHADFFRNKMQFYYATTNVKL